MECDWFVFIIGVWGMNGKFEVFNCIWVEWVNGEMGWFEMCKIEGSDFELLVDLVFFVMGFLVFEFKGMIEELKVEFDLCGNVFVNIEDYIILRLGVFVVGDMCCG